MNEQHGVTWATGADGTMICAGCGKPKSETGLEIVGATTRQCGHCGAREWMTAEIFAARIEKARAQRTTGG